MAGVTSETKKPCSLHSGFLEPSLGSPELLVGGVTTTLEGPQRERWSQQSPDVPPRPQSARGCLGLSSRTEQPRESLLPHHSQRDSGTAQLSPAKPLTYSIRRHTRKGGCFTPLRFGGSLLHSDSNQHTLLQCKIQEKWIVCPFRSQNDPEGPEQCLAVVGPQQASVKRVSGVLGKTILTVKTFPRIRNFGAGTRGPCLAQDFKFKCRDLQTI